MIALLKERGQAIRECDSDKVAAIEEKINEKNWSKQQATNDLQNLTLKFVDSMEMSYNFQGELDPCQMTKNSGMAFGQLL